MADVLILDIALGPTLDGILALITLARVIRFEQRKPLHGIIVDGNADTPYFADMIADLGLKDVPIVDRQDERAAKQLILQGVEKATATWSRLKIISCTSCEALAKVIEEHPEIVPNLSLCALGGWHPHSGTAISLLPPFSNQSPHSQVLLQSGLKILLLSEQCVEESDAYVSTELIDSIRHLVAQYDTMPAHMKAFAKSLDDAYTSAGEVLRLSGPLLVNAALQFSIIHLRHAYDVQVEASAGAAAGAGLSFTGEMIQAHPNPKGPIQTVQSFNHPTELVNRLQCPILSWVTETCPTYGKLLVEPVQRIPLAHVHETADNRLGLIPIIKLNGRQYVIGKMPCGVDQPNQLGVEIDLKQVGMNLPVTLDRLLSSRFLSGVSQTLREHRDTIAQFGQSGVQETVSTLLASSTHPHYSKERVNEIISGVHALLDSGTFSSLGDALSVNRDSINFIMTQCTKFKVQGMRRMGHGPVTSNYYGILKAHLSGRLMDAMAEMNNAVGKLCDFKQLLSTVTYQLTGTALRGQAAAVPQQTTEILPMVETLLEALSMITSRAQYFAVHADSLLSAVKVRFEKIKASQLPMPSALKLDILVYGQPNRQPLRFKTDALLACLGQALGPLAYQSQHPFQGLPMAVPDPTVAEKETSETPEWWATLLLSFQQLMGSAPADKDTSVKPLVRSKTP